MRIQKRIGCAAVVLLSLSACMTVQGVALDWDDLTNSQQQQAYENLQKENDDLKEEIAGLRAQISEGGNAALSGTSVPAGSEASAPVSSDEATVLPSESSAGGSGNGTEDPSDSASGISSNTSTDIDTFLSDIASSFRARQEVARTKTNEEVSAMPEDDMWNFRFRCAEAERSFRDKYAGSQLDDLNLIYLCTEYCGGLDKQYQAQEVWQNTRDSEEANRLYTAGYYNRAYALVELCEYYGLDLEEEYQNLKNAVMQMDALSGEETRNAYVDPQTVTKVQELLNKLGFRCGTPDGIAGRQTASVIERFQLMYGFEPADGIIDDELIRQLTEISSGQ